MSIHGKMVLNKHFSLNFGLVCKKEMQFIWLEIVQKDYLKMLWVMIRSQVIKNKIKKKPVISNTLIHLQMMVGSNYQNYRQTTQCQVGNKYKL